MMALTSGYHFLGIATTSACKRGEIEMKEYSCGEGKRERRALFLGIYSALVHIHFFHSSILSFHLLSFVFGGCGFLSNL